MKINLNKRILRGARETGNPPQVAEKGPKTAKRASRLERAQYTPSRLRPGKRRMSGREKLIVLLPALAAILAVGIVLFTVDKVSVYKIRDTAYQYYGGRTVRIESSAELRSGTDGTVFLKTGKQTTETTLPVYLENSRKVVLTSDMLYISPRIGGCSRAVHFSEVECKTNQMISVSRGGSKADTERGFLYDGEDFYLFLEPVTVNFNGYTMDLPALSYVEAVYGGYMMLFNYDTKEFFMELSDGTGSAQPASGDYVISLLGDSMTLNNGNKLLLANRPELFDPVV